MGAGIYLHAAWTHATRIELHFARAARTATIWPRRPRMKTCLCPAVRQTRTCSPAARASAVRNCATIWSCPSMPCHIQRSGVRVQDFLHRRADVRVDLFNCACGIDDHDAIWIAGGFGQVAGTQAIAKWLALQFHTVGARDGFGLWRLPQACQTTMSMSVRGRWSQCVRCAIFRLDRDHPHVPDKRRWTIKSDRKQRPCRPRVPAE